MQIMIQKYTGSIKNRLRLIILFVVFSTGVLGYGTFVWWYMSNQQDRVKELSNSVSLVLSQDLAKLALLNQVEVASDITAKLKSFSSLEKMVLFNQSKIPVYKYSSSNDDFATEIALLEENNLQDINYNQKHFVLHVPAKYQEMVFGTIMFQFESKTFLDIFKRDFYILAGLSVMMFIFSFVLAEIFSSRFTQPILKLVSFLEKVEFGDSLNNKILTNENNEFGKLYYEINEMLERINKSQEAQKLASVAFETQSGMMITDAKTKILQINRAFTKITGYTQEDLVGKTPSFLQSGYHDKSFYKDMWTSLNHQHVWNGEIYNKKKSGEIYPEYLTIQSVLDENGNVIYYVGGFLDLTLQKQQEQSLKEQEALLFQQSKMASLGEMLENIAHQWRQPLSMITSLASGLRMQKEFGVLGDEDIDNGLTVITNSAKHLSQTIDDFRSFFKDNKQMHEFDISQSISKSISLMSTKFKHSNVEIIFSEESFIVSSYENELIQVFMNILSNAKDALDESKQERKIIVITIKNIEDSKLQISFQDNAGGIPENVLPFIFNHKFTTKIDNDGTGIGLYMSKLIMEKLKGKIIAVNDNFLMDDVEYKGANFLIEIAKI